MKAGRVRTLDLGDDNPEPLPHDQAAICDQAHNLVCEDAGDCGCERGEVVLIVLDTF